MTTEFTLWIDNGQGVEGEFLSEGTVCDRNLIRLKVTPPNVLTNEISIFFWDDADMVKTAKTFRRITEAIERKLWPEMEPDWSVFPMGWPGGVGV